MSNYVCPECGANYIDCGHNKPAVLAQDIKIAQIKNLLKQSRVYVLIDTEDYEVRTVSKSDREAAKKLLSQIDEVLK